MKKKNTLSAFMRRLTCMIIGHSYTCAAEQGIKPTQKQIDAGVAGFWNYATMYCEHCGHVYKHRS